MNDSKSLNPFVTNGSDAGRVKDIELAELMAYAEKPAWEGSPEDFGHNPSDTDILKDEAEILSDEVYDEEMSRRRKLGRVAFNERVVEKRSWGAVNKPASAGLPTLGKRH